MIRLTIEMIPRGDESRARVLARGTLTNIGGTLNTGDYRYNFSQQGRPNTTSRIGDVSGFPRRAKNVWHLLKLCLNEAF